MSGVSGREYMFLFNPDLGAYAYEPADEFEINDIFELVAFPMHPFRYGPVVIEGERGNPSMIARIAPWLTPDKYAENSIEELAALCADCGFCPKSSKDAGALRMQLDAYFIGRAIGEKQAKEPAAADVPQPEPAETLQPEFEEV
ncbi:MAG: hypothetical protein Q8M02_13135 [Candidatus Didemnitutus sp.]|nr:hypothetical protein [Candidatus Didemnitutus sp.]